MLKVETKNATDPAVAAIEIDKTAVSPDALISSLPRLLYIGDVPVESSYHGSALLFRLLQSYPVEKLRIVETGISVSEQERRLPRVKYTDFSLGGSRWLYTRFHRWVSSYFTLSASRRAGGIPKLLDGFQPDAILTVAHGYGWLTAAQYAQEHKLPLHLIVHDDWPYGDHLIPPLHGWLDRKFGHIYRIAASRFCVSPFMVQAYQARYGVRGDVLYPTRAVDYTAFDEPPERLSRNDHVFTVAFAGSINSFGYMHALIALAEALEPLDGQLLIFGPLTVEATQKNGLARANVKLRGLVSSRELIVKLREEADTVFAPMSFDLNDRANMEMSFPSKLTDYTVTGLPLLIYGPGYSSVVRWALENQGVAEVVQEETEEALSKSLERLAKLPSLRNSLGQRALVVGKQYFGYDVAVEQFLTPIFQRTSDVDCKGRT